MKYGFLLTILFAFILSACGALLPPEAWMLTPPAISVQITDGYCPSVEAQSGMTITWTNLDDEDRLLIIVRADAQGVIMDSGGTDLLQPGATFSIVLTEAGDYTYYCSLDRTGFGTIRVSAP
jgi:plastocyanin